MIRRPPRSTLSLHDALPISLRLLLQRCRSESLPDRVKTRQDQAERLDTYPGSNPGRIWEKPRRFDPVDRDRKSTRLNSSHSQISYAVFCLKKKKNRPPTYTS